MKGQDEVRNVTLSLPRELLRRAKVLAAERGTSVSALIRDQLEALVSSKDEYDRARRRQLALMKKGFNLGTGGKVPWTRGDLHER